MKKTAAILFSALLILQIFTAGAQGAAKQPEGKLISTNIPRSFPIIKLDPTYTQVTLAYAVNGKGERALLDLLIWFNSTIGREKKIYVKGVYVGVYDKMTIGIKTALQPESDPKNLPDLCQLNSAGAFAAYYPNLTWNVDLKDPPERLVILEELLTAEKQMWIKDKLNPNAKAACSYKGKLVGLPFGSEMMGLHYNADAFKAAGLDPMNPPKTMEEYAAAAGKLLIKDSTGNVKRYGAAGRLDVRLLSTWIPRMKDGCGGQFNNEEGRAGFPYIFLPYSDKKGTLTKVLTEWKKLMDTGANDNADYNNYEIRQRFENGMTAMYMASTVNMEGTLARFAAEKDKTKKFDGRLARLPKLMAEDAPGQTIGGYGLYLFNNGDETRKKAAFEFIKFAASVDASAYFTANSGYYPTNTDAMNTKYVQDALKKNAHRKLSFDLLTEAARNTKAQEPFIPHAEIYNIFVGIQAAEMAKGQSVEKTVSNIMRKASSMLKMWSS